MRYKREFVGELSGTFILVIFGCGSVAGATLFNSYNNLFQMGIVWGIGVSLAIYATRHLSCAHLNPAVTLAMVTSGRMKASKMPTYIVAQFLGAILAGLVVFLLFNSSITSFENANNIVRGSYESIQTAKLFGEFYNQPGSTMVITMPLAIAVEGFGTFLLVLLIFSLTDGCNLGRPNDNLTPVFIGLAVASIIFLIAPLTQAGLNPARDLGPRMVAWIFGWGSAAFPDKSGGFILVYVLAPLIGGQAAGFLFTKCIEPLMKNTTEKCSCRTLIDKE